MRVQWLAVGSILVAASAAVAATRSGGRVAAGDRVGNIGHGMESVVAPFAHAMSSTGRRECPHDWEPRDSVVPAVSVVPRLPGDIVNVPEFHDCQRALVDSGALGLRYGPHIAIFAAQQLGQLVARLDSTFDSTARRDARAYGAAEIWSSGRYPPLAIDSGQNCLFLWREGGTWRASMVQATAQNLPTTYCQRVLPTSGSLGGTPLLVVPRTHPGERFTDEDYPAVARWDWDATHQVQYIGIKCGAAWCEVGRADLVSSPTLPVIPGMGRRERRVRLIKGWHDYQLLATLPPTGTPQPTSIRGYFVPAPDLGQQNEFGDFATFRPVASVILDGPKRPNAAAFEKYRRHFGFADVRPGLRVDAVIALCYGTRTSCGIPAGGATACSAPGPGDDPPWVPAGAPAAVSQRWYTRVTSGGSVRFSCATRYRGNTDPATGRPFNIPGTVRWRWKVDDEGGWMRCIFGCCELL